MHLSMLCPRGGGGGYLGLGGNFDHFLYPEGGDMLKLWNCKQPQGGELWPNEKKSIPDSKSRERTSRKESSHILQDFGFGLIFFNVIAIRVTLDSIVVLYYLSVVQTSILSSWKAIYGRLPPLC